MYSVLNKFYSVIGVHLLQKKKRETIWDSKLY
jgi:hypothetical protein